MTSLLTCLNCGKNGYKNKKSLAEHKRSACKGTNLFTQDGGMVTLQRPKTDDEFVNEHLDNNKHLYNEEEWNNLKRKANSGVDDGMGVYKIPKTSQDFEKDRYNNEWKEINGNQIPERTVPNGTTKQDTQHSTKKELERHDHQCCSVCSMTFSNDGSLAEHWKTHPACPCGARFSTKSQILKHQRKWHKKVKRQHVINQSTRNLEPITCGYCGDDFNEVYSDASNNQSDGQSISDDEADNIDSKSEEDQFVLQVANQKLAKIAELINNNEFEELANDEDHFLLLQLIVKGLINQRFWINDGELKDGMLTDEIKGFMYKLASKPSKTLLLTHKEALKGLVDILMYNNDLIDTISTISEEDESKPEVFTDVSQTGSDESDSEDATYSVISEEEDSETRNVSEQKGRGFHSYPIIGSAIWKKY